MGYGSLIIMLSNFYNYSYNSIIAPPEITGLHNRGSQDLNGQLTANLPINSSVLIKYSGLNGHIWSLVTGYSGIETSTFLVPIDYSLGNPRVWIMVL